jgi:hypothetical protein
MILCGMAIVTRLAKAEPANNSVQYSLKPDSSFIQGCLPPCPCPLLFGGLVKASFLLTPTGFDGLFNTYAVSDVKWGFVINNTNLFVTGSGTYKIGGEVAVQQELALDLHLGAGTLEHFDSGLVAMVTPFPEINVSISANSQPCFLKEFRVHALPVTVPQIHIHLTSTNTFVLSWPVSTALFLPQQTSDLSAPNWATLTNAPTVIGQLNQLILDRPLSDRFYRLAQVAN